MIFPIAGIEANPWLLFLAGLIFGVFMAQAGITGAILSLPFMISAMGFTAPIVSPTNLVANLLAPLGGVLGFYNEKRLLWSLGIYAGIGGVLGSFIGPVIRVELLQDPGVFKILLGFILALLAIKLLLETRKMQKEKNHSLSIETIESKLTGVKIRFSGKEYSYNPLLVVVLGFFISIIGTTLGVSGAFILVPLCILFLGLPIYIVAGAILFYTLITSMSGILNYMYLLPMLGKAPANPDWMIGLLLGSGMMIGGYVSASFVQKRIPQKFLKIGLGVLMLLWGGWYVISFLL